MAKKATKKNTVTPDPKTVKIGIAFEDLSEGDYFIMDRELWQKLDECATCQGASNVLDGAMREDLCDEKVIPAVVAITWEVK